MSTLDRAGRYVPSLNLAFPYSVDIDAPVPFSTRTGTFQSAAAINVTPSGFVEVATAITVGAFTTSLGTEDRRLRLTLVAGGGAAERIDIEALLVQPGGVSWTYFYGVTVGSAYDTGIGAIMPLPPFALYPQAEIQATIDNPHAGDSINNCQVLGLRYSLGLSDEGGSPIITAAPTVLG